MIFEDLETAAEAFTTAFDYMEWVWQTDDGKSFRPRREDMIQMLLGMKDSLLSDEGQHDFIKAQGLMVDLTDAGNIVYRLEPDMEHVYRLSFARNIGARFD